ncbi:hypothetical protein P8452_32175 [Trifolium repens]|nr:hypothetical protein P8452_32175 [Trifolium repens]
MTLKLSLHFHHTSPLKTLNLTSSPSHLPIRCFHATNSFLDNTFTISSNLVLAASKHRPIGILTACIVGSNEQNGESEDEDCCEEMGEKKELVEQSVWNQMKEIVKFTGPAIGLWLCDPLMSLIDTAVVGQGSSTELAALGPATVVCDYMTLTFMFLSVVTSNIIATALAKQNREDVQHHLSILLFIGLACGLVMLLSTKLFGAATLSAFTGPKNAHVVPAANTYVQIRALSWPALLVGWVAQSARGSMGYNGITSCCFIYDDSNPKQEGIQCICLLRSFNEGIFNNTWSCSSCGFLFSTYIHCYINGYINNGRSSSHDSNLYGVYEFGKGPIATKVTCDYWSYTWIVVRDIGTSLLWLFPYIFTSDQMVIQKMHRTLIPFFVALGVTPSTRSLEGTLLAGQDLSFFSLSTCGCFCLAALLLLIFSRYGLQGCWFTLAGFQCARFSVALLRLVSPNGILYSGEASINQKLRTA